MSTRELRQWTAFVLLLFLSVVATVQTRGANSRQKRGSSCAEKFKRIPSHTACATTSSDVLTSGVSEDEKKQILAQHNSLRESVNPPASNMLKLQWDDEVAMLSQKWAETCADTHDENQQRYIPGRFSTGQNLAFGYGSWSAAITAWYDEYKDFTYGDSSKNVASKVGHYTALVWATTMLLGCGFAQCKKSDGSKRNLHFCNYAPGGNSGDTSKPYASGSSASKCPKHKSGKLCDCPYCENDGTIDLDTCNCKCSQKFHTGPRCRMNCSLAEKLQPSYCATSFKQKSATPCFTFSNVPSSCPIMCKVCPLDEQPSVKVPDGGGGGRLGGNDVTRLNANAAFTLISVVFVLRS